MMVSNDPENDCSLAGKAVLVTGGSRGIGAAIAKKAATAGARVAIGYLNQSAAAASVAQEITESGGAATAIQADISIPSEAQRLVATAQETMGGVDGLVNNAGIMPSSPLTD